MTGDLISAMAIAMQTLLHTMVTPPNVSRETFLLYADYVALLLKWNAKINLIGPATEADIWSRHIEDSAQLVPLIPASAKNLIDLGSGGGLPGLVIALARPDLAVTLVEQDQRKAAFLREAAIRLKLARVTVLDADIATVTGQYDVVTARALATLDRLLSMAAPLLAEGAIGLFPKGESHATELAAARQNWRFESQQKTSATHGGASIITISQLNPSRTENR